MANYVCYPMTQIPEMHVAHVTAPAGGITAGSVVVIDTIDNAIAGNFTQFVATATTAANIKTNRIGIVINGGFEQLPDGRRPAGQPDFTQYTYPAGETVPVILFAPDLTFYLSDDCLAAAGVLNNFLIPAAGTKVLATAAARSATVLSHAKIMAKKYFRLGGQFGAGFANGNVCRVMPEVVIA
ncbi:MAG: hypothetical protein RR413_10040 [Christensenellaceae bacterium]